MQKSIQYVQDLYKDKGWNFYTKGDFNLNLLFVRKQKYFTNKFDDELRIIFKEDDRWVEIVLPWTTKAGVFGGKTGIYDPVVYRGVAGIALVAEGFYQGAYKFEDSYSNWLAYPFLRQIKEINVYRDNTRDLKIDLVQPQTVGSDAGIQIHRAGPIHVFQRLVFNWSIGCLATPEPYLSILIDVCRQASKLWGDLFSVALWDEWRQ